MISRFYPVSRELCFTLGVWINWLIPQQLLDGEHLVDSDANTEFLFACQYKYGGIAKQPGETAGEHLKASLLFVSARREARRHSLKPFPDPYHTYLSLASLSLYPPTKAWFQRKSLDTSTWSLHPLDPLLNLRVESAKWARRHIPSQRESER